MSEESLISSLECPVCKDVPLVGVSIFQCVNGHIICGGCYALLRRGKLCPKGRQEPRKHVIN